MTKDTHAELLHQARKALVHHLLGDALVLMKTVSTECGDFPLLNELREVEAVYDNLLSSLSQTTDTSKSDYSKQQKELIQRALRLWSKTSRQLLLNDEKSRYARQHSATDAETLVQQWQQTTDNDERFALQDTIFDTIWTSSLWDAQTTAFWYDFLCCQNALVQQHLVGAITLSLWQFWDDEKVLLLKLLAASDVPEMALQAAAGYIVVAQIYEDVMKHFPDTLLNNTDKTLKENIRLLQPEFIGMIDSEILEKEENAEVERFEEEHTKEEMNETEKNLQLFAAITHKYVQIRMERGLDMSFSKRLMLNMFPFFSKSTSHWWAPFDEARAEVTNACYKKDGTMSLQYQMLVQASHECDLHLYANCNILSSQKVRVEVNGELPKDIAERLDRTPLALHKRVVFNLYRINKLIPIHQYLQNVFSRVLFASNTVLAECFNTQEVVKHAGRLLAIGSKENTLDVLLRHAERDGLTSPLARQIARAYAIIEKDYAKALSYHWQADLLQASTADELREMALCCNKTGRHNEEMTYLQRILAMEPDSMACISGLAHLHYKQGDYEKSKEYLFKLCYEHPDVPPIWGQLILAELHLAHMEQAEKHLKKMLEEHVDSPITHIAAGCYYFLNKNISKTLQHVKRLSAEEQLTFQHTLKEFSCPDNELCLLADALQK
ncbi:MAG: hypothetical protein HUK03_00100 [Bacteroidaceae bacterium]|nr:hypothetical protein [Bacteroidaceae bacterium]